ncbi:hypothetical protein LX32DRAFT_304261 [Colletotrichum zoysiae]|uniref:Uncharacterized protein n=1 Tax=Colletotrichum zoysiae TaxID=1216348 RepID=A0AAD9LTI2_9PEZI|nr:hypothetical protein LX32DRAFT_304261 [Colletotrichum zoysiae]
MYEVLRTMTSLYFSHAYILYFFSARRTPSSPSPGPPSPTLQFLDESPPPLPHRKTPDGATFVSSKSRTIGMSSASERRWGGVCVCAYLLLRSGAAAVVVRKKGPDHTHRSRPPPHQNFVCQQSPVLSCKNDAGGTQPCPFPNQDTADAFEQTERERETRQSYSEIDRGSTGTRHRGRGRARQDHSKAYYTRRHLRRSPYAETQTAGIWTGRTQPESSRGE